VFSSGGGLLFLGGGGGLNVYDARSGKLLRNVNLAQETQATPMTYMVGGRQYIGLSGKGTVTAYTLY
jgi:glucose dehydrogenase